MAPPCYADLGKKARDIFSKNYHLGHVKVDVKTKTANNVEFNLNGVSSSDAGVNAAFETKYLFKDIGCTLKEKWNTDNTILTEVAFEDHLLKGSKFVANANIAPQSGKKSGTLKSTLKGEHFHSNTDFVWNSLNNGTVINGSLVLGHQGWLAGAQLAFNPSQGKLNETNFSVGYQDKDFHLHTNVTDGKNFFGSIYQKLNPNLETGMSFSLQDQNVPLFTLGCLYSLDQDTQVKARINTKNIIGLAFIHRLRPGINLTLNAMIDGKNFNQGGHKLGLGLEFDALN